MSEPTRAEVARIVETLTDEVRRIESTRRAAGPLLSSGCAALDRLLPEGGLRRGTLVEWLASSPAGGAAALALQAAGAAARDGGAVVVIDERGVFYPPAAPAWGIALEQLIVVRPRGRRDHHWALDQTLRSRGVAAVWGWPQEVDDHTLRRWQLAVEASGVLGLLIRGPQARHDPSWAEVRLWVEPRPAPAGTPGRQRPLRVELLRARNALSGGAVDVELSGRPVGPPIGQANERSTWDETRAVHLASSLAATTPGRHSRRA